jgi:phosphoribosylformylglycinamidine synthase
VTLKPVVNDPEGLSIRGGLRQLGYDGVEDVRSGKYLQVTLRAASRADAQRQVNEMCQRLLANPVIEDYQFTLSQDRRRR